MKKFQYLRPASIDEACDLKASHGAAARFIAGGTDLLLEWRSGEAAFDYCIDLTHISDLRSIRVMEETIAIGPLTPLADIAGAASLGPVVDALGRTAGCMCTPQLRTTATIGGNICHASPCSDMAVLLTCLDAFLSARSAAGARTIAIGAFFAGVNETRLGVDELLVGINVPVPVERTEVAYQRATRVATDLAQASAAVRIGTDDGATVCAAKIVIGACAPVPASSRAAGELLLGLDIKDPDRTAIELAAEYAERETSPISDIRCSDDYRRDVSKVLVRRAIDDALRRLNVVPAPV